MALSKPFFLEVKVIGDPADDQILEYNGTAWVNGRKITSGTTEPASPATGDIWLDTN